jgi:hypothetical protein
MKLALIIKEVATNLNLPYDVVNKVIYFTFKETAVNIRDENKNFSVRYIGRFIKKLGKRENYKNYLKNKTNENNNN